MAFHIIILELSILELGSYVRFNQRLFVSRYQTPRDLNISFVLVYIF